MITCLSSLRDVSRSWSCRERAALHAARQTPDPRVELYRVELSQKPSSSADPLSGIFTGNMAKDYRNMVLLSDALGVISEHQDFEALASAIPELLREGYEFVPVSFLLERESGLSVE